MELIVNDRPVYGYSANHTLRPDQDSIVFVHGAALDHSVWILQSRYFAYHRYNVVALDLPGHGRSGGGALATIGALADWLIAVLDAAGIGQASFVGHSMGSLAVLEAAARYPERVQRLALLGGSCPMPVARVLLDAARDDTPAAIAMITLWAHSPASHFGGNRAPGLWMTGAGKRLLEQAAPGVLLTDLNACNEYRNGLTSAAQVQCPTLLLMGQRDMMTPPRAARGLLDALPEVRTVTLQGCGHMMFYERPDETLDALIDFL